MQEYEHAYVELVADDAARLSAEFEHHRVLAGLRASCAAAAFSSGTGGAHDAAEDFAAPCLVEDPVAADFEYLWDSQDPGVAAWRARGGPGVPRGAPWPAVPFLEPGGASPWALDADAPSIVEDRAWRRQLVALRGALAAARAQRHRLPRDARAAYATAAACLALHCALRLRDWRAVKAALALRLRDGGLDHGLLGPQTRLARSLADRHDAAELSRDATQCRLARSGIFSADICSAPRPIFRWSRVRNGHDTMIHRRLAGNSTLMDFLR